MLTDYTVIAAKISPEITALGFGGWNVSAPRALPETSTAGPSVIVRVEAGSARITVRWELVDEPQYALTINIGGIPSTWDEDEVADYALAISIAHNVASLLKHHLA